MSLPLGIMLGRLTPPKGRGIQFYPYEPGELEHEFATAKELGLKHFEWVWDVPENPLLDKEFRAKVRTLVADSGVQIRGVDLQFLTTRDVTGVVHDDMKKICEAMEDIDGGTIYIPFLDASSLIEDKETLKKRLERLSVFLDTAAEYNLEANLETDLPPKEFKALLDIMSDMGVCYDTGNSHHFGYDLDIEWQTYGNRIRNIQIKDRPHGGKTVPLGTGGTDFLAIFKRMKSRGYTGPVTLQAARGEDRNEVETVKGYMKFVNDIYDSI